VYHRWVLFETTFRASRKNVKKLFMQKYEKISCIIFSVLGLFFQKDFKKYYILGQNMLFIEEHVMVIQ